MGNYDRLLCLNLRQVHSKLIGVHSVIASPKNTASVFHSHRRANGLHLHALATYRTSRQGQGQSQESRDVHGMMMHEGCYARNAVVPIKLVSADMLGTADIISGVHPS